MKINPLHIAVAGLLLIFILSNMGFTMEGFGDLAEYPEVVNYKHAGNTYPHFLGDYHGYQPSGPLPDPYTIMNTHQNGTTQNCMSCI